MDHALDSARLDFLEARAAITSFERAPDGRWTVRQGFVNHTAPTLREAIDTAAEFLGGIVRPLPTVGNTRIRMRRAGG